MQQIKPVNRWAINGVEYNSTQAVVTAAEDMLGVWIDGIKTTNILTPGQRVIIHSEMVQDRKKLIQCLMLIDEAIDLQNQHENF